MDELERVYDIGDEIVELSDGSEQFTRSMSGLAHVMCIVVGDLVMHEDREEVLDALKRIVTDVLASADLGELQ